jgi:hypothetical protein
MIDMLLMALIIVLTLGAIAYVVDRQAGDAVPDKPPMFSLLPGDLKYESPSGNFRFYFPVTTSIVLSVVLTLLMRLFS